jgi:hypothetical protein
MKRLAILAVVAWLWGCALSSTGRADTVLFNTFGEPGDTYANTSSGVWGSGTGAYTAFAMAFTPSASATLQSIRIAVSVYPGDAGDMLDAILTADASGAPGATPLETFTITPPAYNGTNSGQIVTADSVAHPSLDAGTTYWLVLQPHEPSSVTSYWANSSPGVPGTNAYRHDPNGSWTNGTSSFGDLDAFEILGTPTAAPEPASLTLLTAGALGLVGYGWRRRRRAMAAA